MIAPFRPATASSPPAYEDVATEYGAALERFVLGYEANPDLRRDLLQEIHVELWRSLPSFEGRCSTRTWVYRVAHNVVLNHIAKRSRDGLSHCLSLEAAMFVAARDGTGESVEQADDVARLGAFIRKLKPNDRQVILLYLEGFDHAEIADVCGLSIENAATKVHRAKQAIKSMFERGGPHAS